MTDIDCWADRAEGIDSRADSLWSKRIFGARELADEVWRSCARRRTIGGNFRGSRIGLWIWRSYGNVLGQTGPTVLIAGQIKPAELMARPAGPAALMAGTAMSTVLMAGPARQPILMAGPTGPTALIAGTTVGGARGDLWLAN